jgi:hypothetical protein
VSLTAPAVTTQRVAQQFIERGPATQRTLGSARGRSGTIRLRPYITAKTRRTILAEVIQNSLPRAVITLARYHAPVAHRPAKPHLTGKRSPIRLAVKWNRIRGATGYVIIVTAGRTQLAGLLTHSTRVIIPTTRRTGTIRVTVRAASSITPPGPAATLTLKAPH